MGAMDKSVVQKLFDINGQFYQDYGEAFAETRRRIQPGVRRILNEQVHDGNWLDLGCGSGALSANWVELGLSGLYEGLDFSPVLIAAAKKASQGYSLAAGQSVLFKEVNLSAENWTEACSLPRYDGVLMFAALHHIPAAEKRVRLLRQISRLLPAGSCFIHSEWQFNKNPKWMTRIQPWSLVGLADDELETGDTLLDWRHLLPGQTDQPGLRYVHLFTNNELEILAADSGFRIVSEFQSDGASGDLSLYQVWRRV
jgi:tRNA (uracil-5-)-methyltransferase TRM9